ncbi:PTS mannose/fructose/sorbose/N-acetylgalactosamine transporter subunit IIC [Listeria monocytogenes]|uniref:PTS mannose/fructose/sorbose/N-acetylgalactosamine transporter subunit IIC n=1 Tax=Listeria monocytogenes TaxID=1639 RepID=UPI0019E84F6D|nr:PTS mannose/fructose/sorbose/N-acetylgalactosamine transporter subunit IIC [Listeria monocytogenes]EED2265085.1 PTS sugar transporter subunit IIC [Listeria monocytogenes]EHB7600831.1 PTS sugar transporter subunit IIC [Listeria monocytogenes]MCD2242758.1 PTS sugar transporter subunit IIC [Listeria monocytogenes]MCD2245425.1 PTS sugar transporter subunit IIC [Listeria monocytogenes]HAO6408816.1 PTS sugar transporter subunit IIC [Listeria monocytogenes]
MEQFGTAILLALAAMLANGEYLFGSSMLSRPLVTCTLAGLIMGATLELAFVGSFSIGASIPPEIISGSILGTAFAISTGESTAVALALGIPIASLVLVVKNLCFIFVLPYFVHKADKYALEGNSRGISRMQLLGGFLSINLPIGIIVATSYLVGSPVIQNVLDAIPAFVITGLGIATGLLPAYGFALLLKLMVNKKNAVFFVFGFALAVYLKVPVTGVAIFAACLALILTGYATLKNDNGPKNTNTEPALANDGGINYEDEEF